MSLEGVVLLEYDFYLNDNLWLKKRPFHSPSASPRYTFQQWSCYVTFVNYVINLTVSFHWTFCFFSAIAFWSLVTWFRCDFFIMSLDDFWHIVHATVADFNCIAIESFVKFLVSWKIFRYQLKECLCNVCWNRFAKGWVKSYYFSLSRNIGTKKTTNITSLFRWYLASKYCYRNCC